MVYGVITLAKQQKPTRATEEQIEAWEAAAKRAGLSYNAWAVMVLDAAAGGDSPDVPGAAASTVASPRPLGRAVLPPSPRPPDPGPSGKRSYEPDFKTPPPERKKRFR